MSSKVVIFPANTRYDKASPTPEKVSHVAVMWHTRYLNISCTNHHTNGLYTGSNQLSGRVREGGVSMRVWGCEGVRVWASCTYLCTIVKYCEVIVSKCWPSILSLVRIWVTSLAISVTMAISGCGIESVAISHVTVLVPSTYLRRHLGVWAVRLWGVWGGL